MSGSFAHAVKERARRAASALESARLGDDVDVLMLAEAEWEHVTRLARTHGVSIDLGAADPGEGTAV